MTTPDIGGRGDCVVKVAFDPLAPTTFTNWCGATAFNLNISNEFSDNKVGDCDDWSAPVVTLKAPAGQNITGSMEATWSPTQHKTVADWVLDQTLLPVQIVFPNATVGQISMYEGEAYLEGLDVAGIGNLDGNAISESVSLTFNGTLERTVAT